jgi:hypothetical protein
VFNKHYASLLSNTETEHPHLMCVLAKVIFSERFLIDATLLNQSFK